MNRLFRYFIALCLLRVGPQDLPASPFLFRLALALNLLVGVVLIGDNFGGPVRALFAASLDIALLLMWIYALLAVFGTGTQRFVQSATALLGGGALTGLLALPLEAMNGAVDAGTMLGTLVGGTLLFVMLWSMVVVAHILRHALEIRMGSAIWMTLVYSVVTTIFIYSLFHVSGS